MTGVRPKKHLGQHFLNDDSIASRIAGSLTGHGNYGRILEIGPGTGVLTRFLLSSPYEVYVAEIDRESVAYLKTHMVELGDRIIEGDFLKMRPESLPEITFAVIGNFPYNISSQIFFRILDMRNEVPEVVCMLQYEVAKRIASPPGNKDYGILSVLLQAWYTIEFLFEVDKSVFIPPPKVQSGVIRLKRNEIKSLPCDEKLFTRMVKQGFQNRRKTLRNALKPLNLPDEVKEDPLLDKRAEQLSVGDFIHLTQKTERLWNR
jgi:16S rRNA (adenine1518-N6/adenine1519-N6)-dimethyltransferase